MNYAELIEKALRGRTVNKAAKDWGIPQPTLDRYVKGRMPDFQTALIFAQEAGIDPGEVMKICAEEEARKKPRGVFAQMGYATAAFLITVNLFLTPNQTEAAPLLNKAEQHFILCKICCADTLYVR